MSPIDWNAVKSRHRLADVVRRSGLDVGLHGRVTVCCPTPDHPDSTPSTQLDLDRDHYRCFGCGARGDVIDWVRNIEGVDASTAIAILDSGRPINAVFTHPASMHGRPSRQTEPPQLDRTPTDRVAAANQAAWSYYSRQTLHQRGAEYLADRDIDIAGLEAESATPAVGHTPSSKPRIGGLVAHLATNGFEESELLDAGLAIRLADGCIIDFFRDRLILPVRDAAGTVTGLLGRDITGRAAVKYLNPPTTATYQKNRTIYRPSQPPLHPDASIVICEGPLDALAIAAHAATAGVSSRFAPIAACGTALSDEQIDQILAVHPRAPVLAGDGDPPGRRANLDWARRMLAKGRETVITTWPDGYDPTAWLAIHGHDGLIAVTRRGCLDDRSRNLRPRHCGAVLTEAVFPDHDPYHRPDGWRLVRTLADVAAALPPAARRRYHTAAASVFANPDRPYTPASPRAPSHAGCPETVSIERIDL
jgi:DNA primase